MLVLSRCADESIMIGDNVVVTVGEINANRVALLTHASRDVSILREELGYNKDSQRTGSVISGVFKKATNCNNAPVTVTRKKDESIQIADNVVVKIVEIRGNNVRLGIEAPQAVSVHRQEVYEAIQRQNRRAAQGSEGPKQGDAGNTAYAPSIV